MKAVTYSLKVAKPLLLALTEGLHTRTIFEIVLLTPTEWVMFIISIVGFKLLYFLHQFGLISIQNKSVLKSLEVINFCVLAAICIGLSFFDLHTGHYRSWGDMLPIFVALVATFSSSEYFLHIFSEIVQDTLKNNSAKNYSANLKERPKLLAKIYNLLLVTIILLSAILIKILTI